MQPHLIKIKYLYSSSIKQQHVVLFSILKHTWVYSNCSLSLGLAIWRPCAVGNLNSAYDLLSRGIAQIAGKFLQRSGERGYHSAATTRQSCDRKLHVRFIQPTDIHFFNYILSYSVLLMKNGPSKKVDLVFIKYIFLNLSFWHKTPTYFFLSHLFFSEPTWWETSWFSCTKRKRCTPYASFYKTYSWQIKDLPFTWQQ